MKDVYDFKPGEIKYDVYSQGVNRNASFGVRVTHIPLGITTTAWNMSYLAARYQAIEELERRLSKRPSLDADDPIDAEILEAAEKHRRNQSRVERDQASQD